MSKTINFLLCMCAVSFLLGMIYVIDIVETGRYCDKIELTPPIIEKDYYNLKPHTYFT